jgi:ribonuclease HII
VENNINSLYSPKGPVIGPLVVAGVLVKDDSMYRKLNVRDSKKVSPDRRRYLSRKIKELSEDFEIITIPAADIDTMRKTMSLNEIEVYAFSKIINRLKPDTCYVDSADVNAQRFGDTLHANASYQVEIISQHKADERYPVVSAASIIAKVHRDTEVWNIEKELNKKLQLPLGSGYPSDPITITFLETWMKHFGSLPPYTRLSWKTAQTMTQKMKTKRLDEF